MKLRATFSPQLELLGDRTLPSITLTGGTLSVVGSGMADQIQVWRPAAGMLQVANMTTGENRRFSLSSVHELEIRGGDGDDAIVVGVGVMIPATIRGGRGNDLLMGGAGGDTIFGQTGNDVICGRGGNDDLHGDDGDDDIRGGAGDDHMDGGRGRDDCNGQSGNDDVMNGMDQEAELSAVLAPTGVIPGAHGSASFSFQQSPAETEREFEVEAENLTPGTTATVTVDGVSVGTMMIAATGRGRLKLELEFDSDHNGVMNFPPNFPEIHAGSTINVQVNGAVVLTGTFA